MTTIDTTETTEPTAAETTQAAHDAAVRKNVVAELQWTPGVDATRIGVGVVGGAVTLTGEVFSFPERRLAERAAQHVKGVRTIAEAITVRNGTTSATDTDIAREAASSLDRAIDLSRDAVRASVRDHVITLSGSVPWHYQRESAVRSVRHLRGVRDVVNDVHVKAPRPSGNIRTAIEAALGRHAALGEVRCVVTVDDGAVVLEGVVGSWDEHEQVDRLVWAAPGVTAVHNRLRVAD